MAFQRRFLLSLLIAVFSSVSTAQSLNVCVFNAKSGKAMSGKKVSVNWDSSGAESLRLDKSGCALFSISRGSTNFGVMPGPRDDKEPFRNSYTSCNKEGGKTLSVNTVLKDGLMMENICGKARRTAAPGQVIFWALPRPFLDFQ